MSTWLMHPVNLVPLSNTECMNVGVCMESSHGMHGNGVQGCSKLPVNFDVFWCMYRAFFTAYYPDQLMHNIYLLIIFYYIASTLSLISKNLKIKIYRTIILPVVLYGCETWLLTLTEERRLRVFENRVLGSDVPRRVWGGSNPLPPKFRRPKNSCQTQPDYENC